MSKALLLCLCTHVTFNTIHAQDTQSVSAGFYFNYLNSYPNVSVVDQDKLAGTAINDVNGLRHTGAGLGLAVDLQFNPMLSLRLFPGISFTENRLQFKFQSGERVEQKIEQTNLELPIQFAIRALPKVWCPAILLGGGYHWDLAANSLVRQNQNTLLLLRQIKEKRFCAA
ncbi:MAG: hypothetical protein AAFO94_16480 [Bacteroidota bacterium]